MNSDAQDPGGSLNSAILQMSGFGGSNVEEDDATAHFVPLTTAARKQTKREKKEAKLLKRKLEGVAKARRREEQAARERAKAAEYAACPKCPKCSLPTVSRGGMVFCSKAWAPVHSKGYFYLGGAKEYGGTGCGWSETPVKGAGEATCKRCGSTVTCTSGGEGGWDGVWYKQKCDNPHCGYRHEGSGCVM